MTTDRARDWESPERLWRQTLSIYPEHPLILSFVGRQACIEGRWPEGVGYFLHAARSIESACCGVPASSADTVLRLNW